MKAEAYIGFITVLIWIFLVGLVVPDNSVDMPTKKINKAITKIWKVEEFELINDDVNNGKNCFDNGCWMKVKSSEKELGMVYVGRVNSCRSGGCSVEVDPESLAFEFFDYFLLADPKGEVLWVKVFNYQATQGHEVMSRGWLNQFKGLTTNEIVIFGEDIESISGATVSASAITQDIQNILSCVSLD